MLIFQAKFKLQLFQTVKKAQNRAGRLGTSLEMHLQRFVSGELLKNRKNLLNNLKTKL